MALSPFCNFQYHPLSSQGARFTRNIVVSTARSTIYSTTAGPNTEPTNTTFSRNLYLPANASAPQFPGGRVLSAVQLLGRELGSAYLATDPFVRAAMGDYRLSAAGRVAAAKTGFRAVSWAEVGPRPGANRLVKCANGDESNLPMWQGCRILCK